MPSWAVRLGAESGVESVLHIVLGWLTGQRAQSAWMPTTSPPVPIAPVARDPPRPAPSAGRGALLVGAILVATHSARGRPWPGPA
jgi:hypothetical protein